MTCILAIRDLVADYSPGWETVHVCQDISIQALEHDCSLLIHRSIKVYRLLLNSIHARKVTRILPLM